MKIITKPLLTSVIAAATLAFLAGCAGMADAGSAFSGLGRISETKSTYDGKRVITVSPAPLYDPNGGWMGVPFFLGAEWNEAYPDTVGLVLQYKSSTSASYISFRSLKINVDGKTYTFDSSGNTNYSSGTYNSVSKRIYTESESVIPIPYDLFKQMMSSSNCTLRIGSSQGYVDALFSQDRIPGGQGTAKHYMIELADRIEGK
jgi:hypothetical protein